MPKIRTKFAAVGPPPLPTPRLALSIPEFCKAHGISEGFFYKLKKQGEGPREMKVGARTLISFESAAEWRCAREARHSRGHRESARSVQSGETDLPARKLGTRTFILKSDADVIESLPQRPIHDARTRAEDGRKTPSSPSARTEK